MSSSFRTAAAFALVAIASSSCVSVSTQEGTARVASRVAAAGVPSSATLADQDSSAAAARTRELLASPLTAQSAVELALLNHPRIRSEFARLGIAQSDLVAASRLSNPVFSGSRTSGDGSHKSTLALTQSLSDLVLLSARKHLAAGEYERAQELATSAITDLAADVESAWFRCAAAEHVAAMREAVARAAQASSDLAQRMFDAGNISELQRMLERSAAARARIDAVRARSEADQSRFALQQSLGLSGEPSWTLAKDLPAPIDALDSVDELLKLAQERRADLAAARRETALLGEAVGVAKRWAWLSTVEVGVAREREQDGSKLTGPTLALALPIFNQGQAGIARAEAEWADRRARLAQLESAIDGAVRSGHARVLATLTIVQQFATELVPAHATVVKRQPEMQNFMLIGQFELLLAKQQQYDAHQGYLEAVSDYWLARVELARATGGRLPSDAAIGKPALGVDAILEGDMP